MNYINTTFELLLENLAILQQKPKRLQRSRETKQKSLYSLCLYHGKSLFTNLIVKQACF